MSKILYDYDLRIAENDNGVIYEKYSTSDAEKIDARYKKSYKVQTCVTWVAFTAFVVGSFASVFIPTNKA